MTSLLTPVSEGPSRNTDIDSELLNVIFYPALETADDARICARFIEWVLVPLALRATVKIPAASDLTCEWPGGCEVISSDMAIKAARSADTVLVWSSSAFWAAPAWLRRKAVICDPYASFAASDTLNSWVSRTALLKRKIAGPPEAFADMCEQARHENREVLLIGTGPTQDELLATDKQAQGNPLCIYMSGSVNNPALTAKFPPDIIVAADGASQFSALAPARDFKERVVAIMRSSRAILIVPAGVGGAVAAHWPDDLIAQILTLPFDMSVQTSRSSLNKRWAVVPTGNVMTTMALPIAKALSDQVRFAGVTLHEEERGAGLRQAHWQHANAIEYYRSSADILAMEPASVLPQAGYRRRHFAGLNMQIRKLEAIGTSFRDMRGEPLPPAPAAKSIQGAYQSDDFESLIARPRDFVIKKFEKAQHFPGLLAVFLVGSVLLLTVMLMTLTTLEITLGALSALCLCALVAGLYLMRLRMNRMLLAMEGRLSRQQAAQFENISQRLKALEVGFSAKKSKKKANNS